MPHHDTRSALAIPAAVMKRLPVYYRYLSDLDKHEVTRVSSGELATKIGITASQLRQDLNWFGSFGQQGYGYRVADLLQEVSRILGLHRHKGMVLAGAGHLGRALVNYTSFKRRGFEMKAIFDNNPTIIGEMIGGLPVRDIKEMPRYLKENPQEVGVITTPETVAQAIADKMVAGGIRGIWNFAPLSLKVPEGIIVEHVHIAESLMVLSLKLEQHLK